MNNGYDYSNLYNNGAQPQNGQNPQNPQAPQGVQAAQPGQAARPAAQPQQAQPQQSAYPNVGSSGLNTANTAPTDYSGAPQQPYAGQQTQTQQDAGYTASFTGGGNGGSGGYSYSSAPQQPPRKPRKKGGAKKVLLRVAACVGVFALGFGGGLAGVAAANRLGLNSGSQVVLQMVERNITTDASGQGSAGANQLSTQDVAAMVSPSVVVITTEQMVSSHTWFGGNYVQSGAGSGVVMTEDGYILTCAHVVSGASNVKVQIPNDDTSYTATVVGSDTSADIAVLKIEATGLTPVVMGNSDTLTVGESVVAVGNPLGALGGTVTNGIVSAVNREVNIEGVDMTLIQTNASISPGNSGGGLFNAGGELIGIVNAKSGASDAEGLGFAIPVNNALEVARDLIDNGYVKRPALGVTVINISDSQTAMQYGVTNYGVYIAQVGDGSAAAAAGLKMGDRIVAVDDVVIGQTTDLTGYVQGKQIGDEITVQVERDGKLMSFAVTLGETTG